MTRTRITRKQERNSRRGRLSYTAVVRSYGGLWYAAIFRESVDGTLRAVAYALAHEMRA